MEWWIAGDDQWHVPAASPSLRQRCLDHTPVLESVMRVPGGDVAWRVAATATVDGGAIVAELANRASIPVAIGIALIAPDGARPRNARRPALHFTAPARSVADELGVELLVHPVTHGTTFRCSIGATSLDELPPIDAIVRGWQTLTRQCAQIDLGDPTANDVLTAARASLLLHSGAYATEARRRDRAVAAEVATALTLLGYEDDAGTLRVGARLKPRRRGLPVVAADPIEADDALHGLVDSALFADASRAARFVIAVREQLLDDSQHNLVDLFPASPQEWRGRSVDVTNLPTNYGPVSFALRWHGDNPALLWEAPRRVTLRAPELGPGWSTKAESGEELLRPASA
ncbi:MAG TPA: hypothetical protein VMZ22_06545 [Acidimicrobiales bacterium]|nr:hypothetical protein [Acidimicrobiales bacterium]